MKIYYSYYAKLKAFSASYLYFPLYTCRSRDVFKVVGKTGLTLARQSFSTQCKDGKSPEGKYN